MIASRCKRMFRLKIIYSTTAQAIQLLHRLGNEELIPADLLHYLDEDDYNQVIYYCKGDDAIPRLEKVIRDAQTIRDIMGEDVWHDFSEYQLLVRVLMEQTKADETGKTIAKDKSEITAASLQNPSDPDATYRSKAGRSHKGYVGNVIETVGENGESLITGAGYEQNIHSDSEFCKEYLNNRLDGGEPEVMIADGAYSGKDNQELADSKNTELITTALTGKVAAPIFVDFRFSEDGKQVMSCPKGNASDKTTYYPKTGMCRALFKKEHCDNCPHKEECKSKPQKKNYAVHGSANMMERVKYLEKLSTDEYIQLTRKRNAIEGIPSVLRRRYHVDDIPVLGYLRSRQFFWFKIGAYNFNKLLLLTR